MAGARGLALKRPSALPGFGLALGFTLTYLSLIVLIPLAALILKTASLGFSGFWEIVTAPRTLAALRVSFVISLIAAAINVVFGVIVAWVLIRYRFPGRRVLDAIVDLPFALPTAVAGIALTAIYAPNGWIGSWLAPLGIKVAYTPLGIGVAVYTGILLGAMPSRPLWNSPILALLFLVSAMSTGIAAIILARSIFHDKPAEAEPDRRVRQRGRRMAAKRPGRRYHETGYLLATTDVVLISTELLVIFLFIMFAHLTVGNLKYAMEAILHGGAMSITFWVWVVLIGLVIPALVELYTVLPRMLYNVPFQAHRPVEFLVSAAVLIGGFMLRYVIVVAGQITGPTGI